MIDLDAIFNPAQVDAFNAARFGRQAGVQQAQDIGPDDLPGDWRMEFEERAAIMEYDGNMPRERAEALALADVVGRMRASHA
jgi:hypothetical protein